MSFGTQDDSDEVMNEINMTPLVDVMLVLLIIFIITVPVMKDSVNVDLPRASNEPELIQPETVNLSITADVHRLFPVLEEDLILRQPVLKVLLPFSLQSFGPCQPWFFLFFCHTYLLLFFGLRIHVHDITPLPLHPSLFTEITTIALILMGKESACFL